MPTRILVTHKSPDIDAIMSVWLFKRFDEHHFGDSDVAFVNPGDEISLKELAELGYLSYDAIHVDTGGGEFDHHTEAKANERICAAKLVLNHLQLLHPELARDTALEAMVEHAISRDLFEDCYWPEATQSRSAFYVSDVLYQLKSIGLSDQEMLEFGLVALDSVYARLKLMHKAADELKDAYRFDTTWGQGIAKKTANNGFIDFAQKSGNQIVITKDPNYHHIRIKAAPQRGIDLSGIYEKISNLDSRATWYFHPSKTMILNGSDSRRDQVASSLSLDQVISLFKD